MFTGIIQALGKIEKISSSKNLKHFFIKTPAKFLKNKKVGDSIAMNGTCLTVTKVHGGGFEVDVIQETLDRTNLGKLKINDEINLEPSLIFGDSLDGHLVQGHVDAIGKVEKLVQIKGKTTLTMRFPQNLSKHLAFKGSVTINGVSLTISELQSDTFSVELIPHTLKNTNLKDLKKGDEVNLEIDIISRYLERLLDQKADETKYEFLRERNLI